MPAEMGLAFALRFAPDGGKTVLAHGPFGLRRLAFGLEDPRRRARSRVLEAGANPDRGIRYPVPIPFAQPRNGRRRPLGLEILTISPAVGGKAAFEVACVLGVISALGSRRYSRPARAGAGGVAGRCAGVAQGICRKLPRRRDPACLGLERTAFCESVAPLQSTAVGARALGLPPAVVAPRACRGR